MYKSNFEVLKWTFDKGEKTLLRNLAGRIEEQDYAGIIFLFLLDEDELEWPNKIRTLKKYNLYDSLKKISREIKAELGDGVERMISLLEEVEELKMACGELIEEELRHYRLKGRCRYV